MAAMELQGRTLGEKHRKYNKLVQEAFMNEGASGDFNPDDSDVQNLIKIDVACRKRDVAFLLNILKCNDMLYVSRAIKHGTWLITDRQYSDIINPDYLHTHLFPLMTSQASAKLMLHIRLHLRDQNRVEDFYNYFKEKEIKIALNWLPHCSLPVIENAIKKHDDDIYLNKHLLKRLCERSIITLEKYCQQSENYYIQERYSTILIAAMFLINTDTEKYLDIVETLTSSHIPSFGPKHTGKIMKVCPQRIKEKFEKYAEKIDLPTFTKYLKQEEIKDFLVTQREKKDLHTWFNYDNLKHFIRYMPKEGRFNFIKKIFIEKQSNDSTSDDAMKSDVFYFAMSEGLRCGKEPSRSSANVYRWYRFAPFEVAFPDLTKLIRSESSPSERIAMIGVLWFCARRSQQHQLTVLQYYNDKHINEPFKFKIQFVNMVLSQSDTYKFDEKTWNILNNLFYSMEVYIESDNNVQSCIETIIVYKILHNESIPEIIAKKFNFNSLKSIQKKLTVEENEKVFSYLYNLLTNKLQNKSITNESDMTETVDSIKEIMSLLVDWKRKLVDHPLIQDKIKEIIKIKIANRWKTDLSPLYDLNKSWRRIMFEESLLMCPTEGACYNALKHDPELLSRHEVAVEELRRDDNVTLRRPLRALRVYWPDSLAAQWAAAYVGRLSQPGGHKALVEGLCALLPLNRFVDILKEYAPTETKINWIEDDERVLSLRKQLAKNMYLSRPLPPLDIVLQYAQGDYLQFTLPSLNAVLHNMSFAHIRDHVTKPIDAPVSLQKHCIRYAFTKVESEELKKLLYEIWEKAKNPSIRDLIFQQTYNLLCIQKESAMIEEIWNLLSSFIDNLSKEENETIYLTLGKFYEVPLIVRGKYIMKSFKLLKSIPPIDVNAAAILYPIMLYIPDFMEFLDSDFVEEVLSENLDKTWTWTTQNNDHTEIIASYLLCTKDEESQHKKYNNILLPILERSFAMWDVKIKCSYWVIKNVQQLLDYLTKYFHKFVLVKGIVFPTKLFADIQNQLEKRLPMEENYYTLTVWKLITAHVKLLEEHKDLLKTIENDEIKTCSVQCDDKWNEVYSASLNKFTDVCLEYLKKDIEKYLPPIYWIFADCLEKSFSRMNRSIYYKCLKAFLKDEAFIPSYLVVLKLLPEHTRDGDEAEKAVKEIRDIIFSHPSMEIKMHYFKKYRRHDLRDTC